MRPPQNILVTLGLLSPFVVSCGTLERLPVEDFVPLDGLVNEPLQLNSPAVPILVGEEEPEEAPAPDSALTRLRLRTLLGTTVVDADHAPLGIVEDFWIERASGELAFLVIAGEHGEQVFVPQACLRWNRGEGLSLLNTVRQDLEKLLQRSEAPDHTALFAERELETLEGRLTRVKEESDGIVYVKLREANNHLHRVLVAPSAFLDEIDLHLEVDQLVRFDAVETRDDRGRLWVSSGVKRGARRLRFRDQEGRALWQRTPEETPDLVTWTRPEPGPYASARALAGGRHVDPDQLSVAGSGLVLSADLERVEFLVVLLDEERLLPWSDVLEIGEDGAVLRTRRGRIASTPVLRPGDLTNPRFWSTTQWEFDDLDSAAAEADAVESTAPRGTIVPLEPSAP